MMASYVYDIWCMMTMVAMALMVMMMYVDIGWVMRLCMMMSDVRCL